MPLGSRHVLHIRSDSDPDALNRIAGQIRYANVAPWAFELATVDSDLVIRVELRDVSGVVAEHIRRKLLQQVCVVAVSLESVECRDETPRDPVD
jgi:hypothetical protein